MDRKNTNKDKVYISEKILGQLYDQVERTDFAPDFSKPFNRCILEAYDIPDAVLANARQLKEEYDAALCRIMAKLDIKTEFEVWSTFALSHNKSNDYKFHEEIGQLSTNLKIQYRDLCVKAAGGKHHDQLGPFVAAMYQITAEEMAVAVKRCNQTHIPDGRPAPLRQMKLTDVPLMSFPWIFHDVLGKIANSSISPPHIERQAVYVTQLQVTDSVPKKRQSLASAVAVLPDLETAQGVIHQGDLFKPFASQHMKDLEGRGDGNVPHSVNTELQIPLRLASQTAISDVYHSTTNHKTFTAGLSPLEHTSDASSSETLLHNEH